jgi:hypothetical protein
VKPAINMKFKNDLTVDAARLVCRCAGLLLEARPQTGAGLDDARNKISTARAYKANKQHKRA